MRPFLRSPPWKRVGSLVVPYDPPAPPSGILLADPSQLPSLKNGANGRAQVAESGLNAQAAGYGYVDGVSSVPVRKISSTTVPNSGNHFTAYATGGPHCSQQWINGSGKRCYTFTVLSSSGGAYFCDWNWDDMVALEFYAMPAGGGEVNHAFSMHPDRKRLVYLVTATRTVRVWDTESRQYADFGIFPYTFANNGGSFTWLHTQLNDVWLAGMFNSNHTLVAVKVADGTEITCPDGSDGFTIDELHLDLVDPYVYRSIDGNDQRNNAWWKLDDNTRGTTSTHTGVTTDGSDSSDDHACSVRGGMFGATGDPGTPDTYGGAYYWNRAAGAPVRGWVGYAQGISNDEDFYTNGNANLFGFQGSFADQWALATKFTNDGATRALRNTAIGLFKLGGDHATKFLVGHQSNTANGDYEQKVRPGWSPDGLFCYWTSWMMTRGTGSPQFQVLGCKLPTVEA